MKLVTIALADDVEVQTLAEAQTEAVEGPKTQATAETQKQEAAETETEAAAEWSVIRAAEPPAEETTEAETKATAEGSAQGKESFAEVMMSRPCRRSTSLDQNAVRWAVRKAAMKLVTTASPADVEVEAETQTEALEGPASGRGHESKAAAETPKQEAVGTKLKLQRKGQL